MRLAAVALALLAPHAAVAAAPQAGLQLHGFRLVGYANLHAAEYADIAVHGSYAYLGTRCGPHVTGGFGVRVASFADPRHPTLVATLPTPPLTRAEDVTVRHIDAPRFHGDLAIVGIQRCSGAHPDVPTGFLLFDVTRPTSARQIGAVTLPDGTVGCHEVDLVQRRDGRVLAACSLNLADQVDAVTRQQRPPAVQLFDVTDPRTPRDVLDWSMPVNPDGGVGCLPVNFAHSARFEDAGRTLYVSYWDAGTVRLDITDAAHPRQVTDVTIPGPDRDNHSMTLANGGRWLVLNSEDFSPTECGPRFGGAGFAWVFDNRDPAHPRLLGSFGTRRAHDAHASDELTVHNSEPWRGREIVSSWYADGILRWTLDHGRGRQLGQFVPGHLRGQTASVWGVAPVPSRNLVLASDMGTGLWIVSPRAGAPGS